MLLTISFIGQLNKQIQNLFKTASLHFLKKYISEYNADKGSYN